MKPELRMRRIAQKTSPPLIPPYADEDTCFVWLGATQGGRFYSSRRKGIIMQQKRAIINGSDSVNRGLMEILNPGLLDRPYRSHQICRTLLCVNPHHWRADQEPPPPTPPVVSDEWTAEEAQELIDLYLGTNERPLDLSHDLLIDIPPALIHAMGYETR